MGFPNRRFTRNCRMAALGLAAALLLPAGCGWLDEDEDLVAETVFAGAVAADEPTAALIARRVLADGGTAADAAVALYFTQAVTQPSMATLGGGGVCLVFNPRGQAGTVIEALEFYPVASRRDPHRGLRPSAVPGNVRGFFALHARYGRLRIEQLLAPAEKLARFGVPVSRAFAADLLINADFVLQDPEARRVFSAAGGAPLAEGDQMVQQNLAAVLSVLRTRGPADFYTGRLATILVRSVRASGGTLTLEELRDFRPLWTRPLQVEANRRMLVMPSPPATAGILASQIVAMLLEKADFDDVEPQDRPHVFAEAMMLAFLDRRRWAAAPAFDAASVFSDEALAAMADRIDPGSHRPAGGGDRGTLENPAGTSFVVVDPAGMAVACTVTPNNLFGVGLMARGTGILLAAAPDIPGATEHSLWPMGPVFWVDQENKRLHMALAGSGGVSYPSAAAWVMLGVIGNDDLDLRQAIELSRLHHSGTPDTVYIENRLPDAVVRRLTETGHTTRLFPNAGSVHPGRINALFCRRGFPRGEPECTAATDDRGAGVAFVNKRPET